MKLTDQITLSAYNLSRRKKTSIQCVAMITSIMLLISFCAFFITTLISQLQDNIDLYASSNYISITWTTDAPPLKYFPVYHLKNLFPTINDYLFLEESHFLINDPFSHAMIIDGTKHFGNQATTHFFKRTTFLDYQGSSIFNHNTMQEFSLRFPDQNMILYGRDIQHEGEILLPKSLVLNYDLSPQYLLSAHHFEFYFMSEWEMMRGVRYSGRVVGIFNDNFFELGQIESFGAGENYSRIFGVFMSREAEGVETIFNRLKLFMSCIDYAEEIRQYIELNFLGLFTSWGNQSIANRLDLISRILTFTQSIVLVLIGAIGLALLFFLYSVIDYNIKQKGSYHGMMRAMGTTSTTLINFIEMIVLTILSAIISAVIFFPTVVSLNGLEIGFNIFNRYTLVSSGLIMGLSFALTILAIFAINLAIVAISSKLNTHKSITKSLRL